MGDLAPLNRAIAPMPPDAIDRVRALERVVLAMPQTRVRTESEFHAGTYARTMIVDAPAPGRAVVITGALIKIPTLLVCHGDAWVYIGEAEPMKLTGYNVLKAAAGRKQAFVVWSAFWLTMSFATEARTVEEAEAEFTDEADMLMSRRA